MKFGKRVASEAARSFHQKHFLDYKACKRAIQQDVLSSGTLQGMGPLDLSFCSGKRLLLET